MAESQKKLKSSNVIFSFIVCSNRNRSALVRELLSNNSLFVGQLYEDKSLALCARDLVFFTTDLQTVNYYSSQQFTARADLFLNYPMIFTKYCLINKTRASNADRDLTAPRVQGLHCLQT